MWNVEWDNDPPASTGESDKWARGLRDVLDNIALTGTDDLAWPPTDAMHAEDFAVREGLGLPRYAGEEDWNIDPWREDAFPGPSSPAAGYSPEIVLSDRQYAEDSAAWAAIAMRPCFGESSNSGTQSTVRRRTTSRLGGALKGLLKHMPPMPPRRGGS